MTPDLGQGACQAIEDAVELAKCLGHRENIEAALELYETRRIRRTAAIVRGLRRIGRVRPAAEPFGVFPTQRGSKRIPLSIGDEAARGGRRVRRISEIFRPAWRVSRAASAAVLTSGP